MAPDTPLKKASPDMPEPDQPKMPKYEYQRDDSRSFSVGYEPPVQRDEHPNCENKSASGVLARSLLKASFQPICAMTCGLGNIGAESSFAEVGLLKRKRKSYQPPPEFSEMYEDLRSKFGPTEARRLITDHAAIMARRRKCP